MLPQLQPKLIFSRTILLLGVLTLAFSSCNKPTEKEQTNTLPQANIKKEIEAAVWAFHAADTAKDAQKIINSMWPECSLLIDGNRLGFQEVAEGSRNFMGSLALFHTEWEDLEIIPLSDNAAISSFIFRDSIISKTGELTQAKGPNTFVWQKRNKEWKILYVDADHYPIDKK